MGGTGKSRGRVFLFCFVLLSCRLHFPPLGWGRNGEAHVTHYLIGVDQKIPGWVMRIMSQREDEIATRSGVKSRLGILGFS